MATTRGAAQIRVLGKVCRGSSGQVIAMFELSQKAIVMVSAAIGITLAPAAVRAQAPPSTEATKSAVGSWELSNADRDRTCALTLKGTVAPGGLALEWDGKCAALFPFTKDVTAWTIGAREAMQLLDPKGKPLLELTEVEGGLYEGERTGEGILFLQSVGSAAGERTAAQMTGEWSFARAGKPVCQVTLTDQPAARPAPADSFAVTVKAGCDTAVARFAPAAWQIDRGQLVLTPKAGEPWRFEEADAVTWRRIPQGTQPLVLVRQ